MFLWNMKVVIMKVNNELKTNSKSEKITKHKKAKNRDDVETIQIGDASFNLLYSKAVPPLEAEQFTSLKDDIKDNNGIIIPIIVDEHANVIDGEHRLRIAQELGIKQIPVQVRTKLTEEEKWKMAQDLNFKRRQLTQAQITQITKENREKLPQLALKLRQEGMSLRAIGDELGVSHTQVKNLIKEEVAGNNLTVDLPDTIKGMDGKSHPAKKPFINVNTPKELQRAMNACESIDAENLPDKPLDLKRVERIARESEREKLRQQTVNDFQKGQIKLLQGDFNIRGLEIPDNSVDLIFTDPPYHKEYLPLWGQLGTLANRVLKPGGLLVSYTGSLYLPKIHDMLGEHLSYLWMAAIYHSGAKKKVHPVGLIQCWKPILVYYKPPKNVYWPTITDMISGGESKSNHDWEQSVGEALHYIKAFAPRNGTLLDPMAGSGTSLLAGLQSGLGLNCIGIELDKATFIETESRLKGYLNTGENSAA